MQPHLDQLRSLASQFASETNIPVSELGVISDNPSSAEAIYAAKEPLIVEAEDLNASNGESLKNIGKMIIAILEDKPFNALSEEQRKIQPMFKNPSRPSSAEMADSALKISQTIEWIKDTDVMLELLGFNEEQRMRMKSDKAKSEAQQAIYGAMAQTEQGEKVIDDTSRTPNEIKREPQQAIGEYTEISEG